MDPTIADFRAECLALSAFLSSLPTGDWSRSTVFYDWTVADEVMHLTLIDDFGLVALKTPEAFPDLVAEVRAGQAKGIELSHRMRERYGTLAPEALSAAWTAGWERLIKAFLQREAKDRIPWFGPDMSVAAFATARQMEVWAHGQDLFDLFRVRRANTDRIRAVCDLGVKTQGWSFRNRGLERPPAPQVRLEGPSGAVWTWSEGAPERISGSAEDFALVVTQRRHVLDTGLVVEGAAARAWMDIAQCFAGPPATGPAPGVRRIDYG